MNICKIISDLREQKGWAQKDLTEKSGISRVMIDRYERGEAVPSIEAAKKIAKDFGVSLDYLADEGITTLPLTKRPYSGCRISRASIPQ